MLLANLSVIVTNEVNDFWLNNKEDIKSNLLDINADELMAIFIYIIMKSQMGELITHLNIIKEFTTSISRNSMMGYYYTTIEAAVIYIKSLKGVKDLESLRDNS